MRGNLMNKMTLNYDKKVVLESFFGKLIDWLESDKKDKKQIVDEAVNTFETMIEANALTVKELNQRVVDETLHELTTKDFVKAEIASVRAEFKAEIASVRAEIAEVKSEIKLIRKEMKLYAIGIIVLMIVLQLKVFALLSKLVQ